MKLVDSFIISLVRVTLDYIRLLVCFFCGKQRQLHSYHGQEQIENYTCLKVALIEKCQITGL